MSRALLLSPARLHLMRLMPMDLLLKPAVAHPRAMLGRSNGTLLAMTTVHEMHNPLDIEPSIR